MDRREKQINTFLYKVKPDRIRSDNLYTVYYSIFIFGFESGTNPDSNIGLCGFEYLIRRIQKRYGNRKTSDRKRTFTIFIYEKYINNLNYNPTQTMRKY